MCEFLAASLSRYGIRDEILTDNGKCFTGRDGPHPTEVLFDRLLGENGISHRHTAVRSTTTTTGRIERFHQSLRREFLVDRTFASLEQAQAELDAWVHEYNTARPHQVLEMATPAERLGMKPLAVHDVSVPVASTRTRPARGAPPRRLSLARLLVPAPSPRQGGGPCWWS